MNNSYITIIKEKRTALSRKRVPLNQNECTDDFRIGVPFEQNLHKNQLEIDFVANLGSKRYYIQSAFSMPTEEKRIQEKASLVSVNDSFKKIIVVKDVVNVTRDEDGITTMSIYDFLLKENSLEL